MPHIVTNRIHGDVIIFTVSQSVGLKELNHPDDVRLVQWLLTQNSGKSYSFADSPLQVDGYYGPATDYHLCRFCLACMQRNPKWGHLSHVGPTVHELSHKTVRFGFPLIIELLNEAIQSQTKGSLRPLVTRMPIPLRNAFEADLQSIGH